MTTWDISSVGKDENSLRRLAEGEVRVYKFANDYGDKVTHTNYVTCKDSSEELSFFRSPLIHNVVLVYDRGNIVNQSVTLEDTPEGRRILGIQLL